MHTTSPQESMRFTAFYTLTVSLIFIMEPFVLHSPLTSLGTWFWWVLGIDGARGNGA